MSTFQAPVTPDRASVGRAQLRRSFTVPPKLSTPTRQSTAEIGAADGIETLYVHPSTKVVSFSTAQSSSRPNSSSSSGRYGFDPDADVIGTLPWGTATERTLAAGPLEIYRVPGSVSFLHSGALLHAILPRSQCWCVDGISIFVLRVLAETYYRIELPGATEEDKAQVEEFKITLKKVLHYERTPCPFRREFSVDLPKIPEKQVRRVSRHSTGPVKRWKLDRVWRPEGASEDYDAQSSRSGSEQASDEEQDVTRTADLVEDCHERDATSAAEPEVENNAEPVTHRASAPRPDNLQSMRSVTAPPKLDLGQSPPSKVMPVFSLDGVLEDVLEHTPTKEKSAPIVEDSVMPPTPESMQDDDIDPYSTIPGDEKQDTPIVSDSVEDSDNAAADMEPSTVAEPTSDAVVVDDEAMSNDTHDDDDSVVSDPFVFPKPSTAQYLGDSEDDSWGNFHLPTEKLRLRKPNKASSHRSSSPGGPSTRIYRTTSTESRLALTDDLVRKTCAVFLGPPAQLVSIMLRIARRLANGAFNMAIPSPAGAHKRVPGSWTLSDDEDDWDIDDYGFPISNTTISSSRAGLGKAWNID